METALSPLRRTSFGEGLEVWMEEPAAGRPAQVVLTQPQLPPDIDAPVEAVAVLRRHPAPNEVAVRPLLEAISIRLDLSVVPAPAQLDRMAAALGHPVDALRMRTGVCSLRCGDTELLRAAVTTTGRARLGGTVERDAAGSIVDAFSGAPEVELGFTAEVLLQPTSARVTVSGSWYDLFDQLVTVGPSVDRETFDVAAAGLLEAGAIAATADPPETAQTVSAAVTDLLWQRRLFLGDPSGGDVSSGDEGRLQLGPPPHPSDTYSFTSTVLTGRSVDVHGKAALSDLVRPVVQRAGFEAVLSLVAVSADGHGHQPVRRSARGRRRPTSDAAPFMLDAATVMTAETVLAKAPIHVSAAPGVVRPPVGLEVVGQSAPPPGPLVADVQADDWPDHADSSQRWYPPLPVIAVDEASFVLHNEGLTGEGDSALRAAITIPFSLQDPAAGSSGERRRSVAVESLIADLEVPFRDAASGNELRHHRIRGRVEDRGDRRWATFEVLNQWSRIAYQALSGLGGDNARLLISYSFPGYVRTRVSKPPHKVFGGILLAPDVADNALAIDPATLTVRHPAGHFVLDPRARAARPPQLVAGKVLRPGTMKGRLAQRTFQRTSSTAVVVACSERPDAYVEHADGATAVIGCRPALQLGQIAYRRFREMTGLRTSRYSIHQSQTDAGRYLVMPARYRIGRRPDDGTETAYRPLVVLHATLATDNDDVLIVVEAGLQPDLRPVDRMEIELALRALDPAAVIQWPSEVPGVLTSFAWPVIDAFVSDPETDTLPNGTIHFAARVTVPGWLLLRTMLERDGVRGTARFDLGDGSHLDALLELDLRRITGPWDTGPVRIEAGEAVRLVNPTTVPVRVLLLAAYDDGGVVDSFAVDRTVPPGGDVSVDWRPPSGARLVADYEVSAAGAADVEEVRTFVEELEMTVVFLNGTSPPVPVDIECRAPQSGETKQLHLPASDPPEGVEARFMLPLTTVVTSPVVEYRVRAGDHKVGPWTPHDISTSAFVTLTRETAVNRATPRED